ncbi:MAG: hypothetical protein HY363_04145 [Candidatus Aenigmarchaeota archaeon]|nr:hypothetical protein [Candidatus Aenigmarchaeota archaeon]
MSGLTVNCASSLEGIVCQVLSRQGIVLDDSQRISVREVELMLRGQKLPERCSKAVLEVSDVVRNILRQNDETYERVKPYGELLMRAFSDWTQKIEVSELLPVEVRASLEMQKRELLDYELDFFVLTQARSQYIDRARQLTALARLEKEMKKKEMFYHQIITLAERKSALTSELRHEFAELQADAYVGLASVEFQHAKEHYASAIILLKNITGSIGETEYSNDVERVYSKIGRCYYALADLTDDESAKIRAGVEGIGAYHASAIHEFKVLSLLQHNIRQEKMSYFVRSLQRLSSGLLRIGRYIAREHNVPLDVLEAASGWVKTLPSLPRSKHYEIRSEIAYGVLNLADKRARHAYRLLWKYPFGCADLEGRLAHNLLTRAHVAIAQGKIRGLSKSWRRKRLANAAQLLSRVPCASDGLLTSRMYRMRGELYSALSSLDLRHRLQYQVRSLHSYEYAARSQNDRTLFGLMGTSYLRLGILLEKADYSSVLKVKKRFPSVEKICAGKVVDACYKRALKNLYHSRRFGDSSVENATKAVEAYLGLARQAKKQWLAKQKFWEKVVVPEKNDVKKQAVREAHAKNMKDVQLYKNCASNYFALAKKEIKLAGELAKGDADFLKEVMLLEEKIKATECGPRVQNNCESDKDGFFIRLLEQEKRVYFANCVNTVFALRVGKHSDAVENGYIFKIVKKGEKDVLLAQSQNVEIKKPQVIGMVDLSDGLTIAVMERMSYTTELFNWMHYFEKKRQVLERHGSAFSFYRLAELEKQARRVFWHTFDQWRLCIKNIELNREQGKISVPVLMLNTPEEYLAHFRKSIESRVLIHSAGKTLHESGILEQILIPRLVKMKRGMARDLNQSNVFINGASCDWDVLSVTNYNKDPASCLEPFGLPLAQRVELALYALKDDVKDIGHEQVLRDLYWGLLWEYIRLSAYYTKRSYEANQRAVNLHENALQEKNMPVLEKEENKFLRKCNVRFALYAPALTELSTSASKCQNYCREEREAWSHIADYMNDVVIVQKKGPFISTKEQIV